jgi:signal transduction histidine kinase
MNLSRLQWVVVALAILFVLLATGVSFVPHRFGLLNHDAEHVLLASLLLAGVVPFTIFVFRRVFSPMYERIDAQNRELRLLNVAARLRNDQMRAIQEAGFALTSELSLDVVLQAVVDLSRALVGARSGALELPGRDGGDGRRFTSGAEPGDEAPVAPGENEVGRDERRGLTVPLEYKGNVTARLSLGEKESGEAFGEEDVSLLEMFATQAAIAIENARLYEQIQELTVVQERERIARELHDNFAQTLGYFNTKIQAVRELLAAARTDAAMTQAEQLEKAARGLYSDVREAIDSLWSSASLEHGLERALVEYMSRFEHRTGIETELAQDGSLAFLQHGRRESAEVFRIVQEALTNVRKHAGATKAQVRFHRLDDHVELCVEDDGRGFVPGESLDGERFGLKAMRQRAESIQAHIDIDSSPGAGTRVKVLIPIAPAEAKGGEP